ncbi:transcription antitermination factor NusB [Candidatus Fermentibacterales bacterium]|nr:transcription antitermination factor NusB [Candidatus Fermentibacterales bacterium]
MGVMSRARRFLLQARYAGEINGAGLEENLADLGAADRFHAEQIEWMTSLGRAVEVNRQRIESLIEAKLHNWRLDRVSIVCRLIMEQAVAEAVYMRTPAAVVIDEALELAGAFEASASKSFVNGVLDAVLKDVTDQGQPTEQQC